MAAHAPRSTPAMAFARAREIVRPAKKVDMQTLARDVGVGRSTLYRWTGDRDQLLADVTWAELDGVLEHLKATTPGSGAPFIERVSSDFLGFLADTPAFAPSSSMKVTTACAWSPRPMARFAPGWLPPRRT